MDSRTLLALLFGSTLALSSGAGAQTAGPARVGILGGMNSATVAGDDADDADRRTGLFGGVYVIKPLGSGISFRPEFLYSQKGAKTSFADEGSSVKTELKIDYFDIPVLLQYEPEGTSDVKPHVYAGPSFAIKARCKVEGSSGGVSLSFDCDEAEADLRSFDMGAMLGAGVSFPLGTMRGAVGARYQHGLTDLEKDASVKNRVLSVYFGFEFGTRK